VADPEISKKAGARSRKGGTRRNTKKLKTILQFITLADPEMGGFRGSESFLPFVWEKIPK
jgi:hypothetical protein